MNREQEILTLTKLKVAQGWSAGEQYAALNKARDKRRRKNQKRLETLIIRIAKAAE